MSSSLVYKSLEIVDSDFSRSTPGKQVKKVKNVFNLIPENHKVTRKVQKKGQKSKKVEVLTTTKKLTVLEVKEQQKLQSVLHQKNLKKLAQIKKACEIKLNKDIRKQIIERAVTKRPVKPKPKRKVMEKTVFTEEDFQAFEKEYFG